ncbi:hypothetical protein Val02_04980 [Virgisporangium aliadipatigenens]|uniref:Uncharacterized protein n=1 Tax=Virgisporangium aliadipatigenens TaxID=741659 RepID=A0A8J3YG41_9ACTN|nr:hypothetical protein [Virgisporangium aliadipatigenens]GIJ43612.1 hypothetical protein Val02_04980 [Virgisporangium aliadipatigenens]
MRTRTVVVLLGTVLGLGIGIDLLNGTGGAPKPPSLVTVAATTCAPGACARVCPHAGPDASRRAEAAAVRRRHGRLAWHCRRSGHGTDRPGTHRRSPSTDRPSPRGSRPSPSAPQPSPTPSTHRPPVPHRSGAGLG